MGCGNHNPEEKVADVCREAGMAIAEKFGLEEARRILPVIAEILLKHGGSGHHACHGSCSHGGGCSCGHGKDTAGEAAGSGVFAPGSPELAAAEELVKAGKTLADLGFMAGCAGNLSMRLPSGNFMVSPAGVRKGEMKPEQMVIMSLDGKVLNGGKPSSEYKIHLVAYQYRPDVMAVLHSHPPVATAFATAGMPLNETALAEAWLALGPKIPLVPFGVPSTNEVVDNLYPYVREHNAFLLANHGTLTYGKNMLEALHRMETLEFLAKVLLTSREIGGERSMRAADIDRLRDAHAERLGLK